MIDQGRIDEAVKLLKRAAPKATIILFGSYARGDARPDSDLDFLVVMPQARDRYKEMVRLAEVLRPLRLPADIIVVSRDRFDYWRDTPNTLVNRAATEGKVYEQVA